MARRTTSTAPVRPGGPTYALVPGRGAQALTSWSPTQTIFTCPPGAARRCKQAYQHVESATGDRIYVTSSRHSSPGDTEHPEYRLELREFRVSWE